MLYFSEGYLQSKKETEIMIDYTKVSDNQHVIELIKKREKIEEQIRKIDEVALVRYELEVLSIPNVVGQREQLNAFVDFYNSRKLSHERINYDEIDIFLESI